MGSQQQYDVIIIGAGAAGMMCAIEAGKRGRKVWLIDHSKKIGEKIRIAGGGRCNFTNIHTRPEAFLSGNPHFCKSALKQFTQNDFIAMVEKHGIAYHEKKLGQLFCDETAVNIIDMLIKECDAAGVTHDREIIVSEVRKDDNGYAVQTNVGLRHAGALVIATGGLSIPKIGATKFGYEIAQQFNIPMRPVYAGLVPLTFQNDILEICKNLTGVSVEASVSVGKTTFREGLLFTHRGLSGPSILQISSYWKEGQDIIVNLAPNLDAMKFLKEQKQVNAKKDIQNIIATVLPNRLAQAICDLHNIHGRIADLSDSKLQILANTINAWHIKPDGTEGYRTAEVTCGGVDTNALSSKTMEAKDHEGLYFIGEVVDVTGHLGGYNFQWAWSSGFVAGQYV